MSLNLVNRALDEFICVGDSSSIPQGFTGLPTEVISMTPQIMPMSRVSIDYNSCEFGQTRFVDLCCGTVSQHTMAYA